MQEGRASQDGGLFSWEGGGGIRNSVRRSAFQLVQASRRLGKPNVEIVDGVIAHEFSTYSSFALGRPFALTPRTPFQLICLVD